MRNWPPRGRDPNLGNHFVTRYMHYQLSYSRKRREAFAFAFTRLFSNE